MSQADVAGYARRLAHVPGALAILRHHPEGLPIGAVAAELGVAERALREELEVFFLADVVDSGALGMRSCALEFLSAGPEGDLQTTDLADAQVVRLTDESPLDELGVTLLSAGELARLYRAASELAELEPDNAVLRSAVDRLGESVLGGVEGSAGRGWAGGSADAAADLRRAATQRRRVRLTYARAWQPGVVERVVEPYRVISTRRGYEMDAGVVGSPGQVRTYLVSGVRSHEVLPETFERPGDVAERVAAARRAVAVRLVLPVDRVWVVDRFAERAEVEASDDDGVQVLAQVLPPVRDRVGLLLAVAGPGAFVVSPDELVDADRETADRLLRHHRLD